MGTFSNLGGTLLDVQQGMEYAKTNQRRDADVARGNKRADMQDELSKYSMEDTQRLRADTSRNREAFASGGLEAVSAAAQKSGDISSHQAAAAAQAAELNNRITKREQENKELMQPTKFATDKVNADAALTRAPGENKIANSQVQAKLQDLSERQQLDMYTLAHLDPKATVQRYNESGLVTPGDTIVDLKINPQSGDLTMVNQDSQEKTIPYSYFAGLTRKLNPSKMEKLKSDETLVEVNPRSGTITPRFTAPGIDTIKAAPADSFLYNSRGGPAPAQPAGLAGVSPKRQEQSNAHQDTRFKVSENIIVGALGGQFDALGKLALKPGTEAIYQRATVLSEQAIKSGQDPAAAANSAITTAQREAKIAGLTGGTPGATTAGSTPSTPAKPVDWNNFVTP